MTLIGASLWTGREDFPENSPYKQVLNLLKVCRYCNRAVLGRDQLVDIFRKETYKINVKEAVKSCVSRTTFPRAKDPPAKRDRWLNATDFCEIELQLVD